MTLYWCKLAFLAMMFTVVASQGPTVYEYFANTANLTGLVAENREFTLNGRQIRIISGAIHYFRIHPALWRDRLRKLRAIGANCVETYVPWNLHEPRRGEFDFGNGTNDFSEFLNVRRYIEMAKEEDLLVLFRPGPYICSEWDYGGLPSWLQTDPNMRVRENYEPYLDRVKIFLDALLPQVADLEFTRGGAIIGVQIENEYNSFNPKSKEYLEFIRQSFLENGLESLFFTSDNSFGGDGMGGTLDGILQTANFQSNPDSILSRLLEVQPDKPLMAMEFWSGWFNHWFDDSKAGSDPQQFQGVLETMFRTYNSSVNFYMFHGGTNFGFMAGANNIGEPPYILSDITSYDYDALISEAGDYTTKYEFAAVLINQYESPKLGRPQRPLESQKTAYPTLGLQRYLTYTDIIDRVPASHMVTMDKPVSMELLPINDGNGQSYGYIVYRKNSTINAGDRYKASWPRDFAILLTDGDLIDTGFTNDQPEYWLNSIKEFSLNVTNNGEHIVDLMVENIARTNFGGRGDFVQQKGIAEIHQSKIEINDQEIQGVEMIALEFKNDWVKGLQNWRNSSEGPGMRAPCLIQSTLTITGEPADTFLDMTNWHKGIVFVNGFNIGRYFKVGPQQTLYIPSPLLNTGDNAITIFEQLELASEIRFTNVPNLGRTGKVA
ncbi:beta-galactosidase-1-like protein 2 [Folsomia candida]|uniref:beta-galactosidase-1-like protein 2 n=1 Tax=Folsomia candida TaxID=158441 RepID=UPI000B90506A|nr:beta-galactosidase-1-like protein 2 [Folsomia candida]